MTTITQPLVRHLREWSNDLREWSNDLRARADQGEDVSEEAMDLLSELDALNEWADSYGATN